MICVRRWRAALAAGGTVAHTAFHDETYAEIDGAVADVDRVIRIFDALLRLAEIDAGMRRSGFVSLDVSDLAANAVEFYDQPQSSGASILLFDRMDRCWYPAIRCF